MNKQITIVQQALEALDLNSLARTVDVAAKHRQKETPVCRELLLELEDAETELRLTAMPSLADLVRETRAGLRAKDMFSLNGLCACGVTHG